VSTNAANRRSTRRTAAESDDILRRPDIEVEEDEGGDVRE